MHLGVAFKEQSEASIHDKNYYSSVCCITALNNLITQELYCHHDI